MPNAHALGRAIGRSSSDEGVLSFYDHMSRIVSRFAISSSEQNKKKNERQTAKPSGIYRFIKNFISIISETATCDTIKCKDRQQCLTDLQTHKPRCVSCSYKCPRVKRPQQVSNVDFRKCQRKGLFERWRSSVMCGLDWLWTKWLMDKCQIFADSLVINFYDWVQEEQKLGDCKIAEHHKHDL